MPVSAATFDIAGREVGAGAKCLIIAEVAQAHDGSLGMAHAYIDAAADAGADAVKFQTHIAAAESSAAEPWRVHFSPQDATRYDYWQRMEFTEEQWAGLARHSVERGLMFLSSPFSEQAVDLLARIGVPAWKVASGEVGNTPLIEYMAKYPRPFLLSSGMSSYDELDRAIGVVARHELPFLAMQCTTSYPCPPERIGLNVLGELRERYNCPVGISDHSGTIYPSLASVVLGGKAVEVHITFSRQMFGPDVTASVTTDELSQLVKGVRFTESMINANVNKEAESQLAAPLRAMFTKSIVAAADIQVGTALLREHITFRKPGTGIPASDVEKLLGRRVTRAVSAGAQISHDDLA